MPSSYSLGEHFEQFVQEQLGTGQYASASEVIRDALRLLDAASAKAVEACSKLPMREIQEHIAAARLALKSHSPAHVVPEKLAERDKAARERGWLTRAEFNALPEEDRV